MKTMPKPQEWMMKAKMPKTQEWTMSLQRQKVISLKMMVSSQAKSNMTTQIRHAPTAG